MESMFQKIKAKLAEDVESESERESAERRNPSGGPGGTDEALVQEVQDLKEHINKNYQVYVRRLEKRKERIKELEEYTKLIISDNETLQKKLQDYEACQNQLVETRDNLDQLEMFQNQELSKVKSMLLSAEKQLGEERLKSQNWTQKQLELEAKLITSEAKFQEERQLVESKVDDVKKEYEAKLKKLEERFKSQDLGGEDALQAVIKERDEIEANLERVTEEKERELQAEVAKVKLLEEKRANLETRLSEENSNYTSLKSERDSLKNSLLELEIAIHERQNDSGSEVQELKLKNAQLTTEMETLEVTLAIRDKELKSRKEELRAEKEKHERLMEETKVEITSKGSRLASMEAENSHLKSKLSEKVESNKLVESKYNDLLASLTAIKESLAEVERDNKILKLELENAQNLASKLNEEKMSLQEENARVGSDHDGLVLQLDEITTANESNMEKAAKFELDCHDLQEKVSDLENQIKEMESSFDRRVEQSDIVQGLRSKLLEAEDELVDKRKAIKLHHQRITDMKKTFQQEMKTSMTSPNLGDLNGHSDRRSSTPSPGPNSTSSDGLSSFDPQGSQHTVTMTEVNFKYLKHVIFKFFTSPEYEAKHLTRAISALLKLTRDEEKLLQQHLDWKMSWFGSKPKLGSGQFSLSIDPN